jgi:hypothetical protein
MQEFVVSRLLLNARGDDLHAAIAGVNEGDRHAQWALLTMINAYGGCLVHDEERAYTPGRKACQCGVEIRVYKALVNNGAKDPAHVISQKIVRPAPGSVLIASPSTGATTTSADMGSSPKPHPG